MNITKRNSSIELMRFLSIVLIISMHILGPYRATTNIINQELIFFVNAVGNMGVTLFVLISGFYGIKFKSNRLFQIINLVIFYSLLSLLFLVCFSNNNLSFEQVLKSFIPISSNKYWFATSYVILYCLSSFLNEMCISLNRRKFIALLSILITFFYILPTVFYYQILNDLGKGPINMIIIYLLGRYLKIYGFPLSLITCRKYMLFFIITIPYIAHHFILLSSNYFAVPLYRDNSLFILISSLYVFHFFINKTFYDTRINTLSKYCFAIYLAHGCLLKYYMIDINSNLLVVYFLIKILLLVSFSILIEKIRDAIGRSLFNHIIELEERILTKITYYIYK